MKEYKNFFFNLEEPSSEKFDENTSSIKATSVGNTTNYLQPFAYVEQQHKEPVQWPHYEVDFQPRRGLNSCLNQTVDPLTNQVGFIQPEGSLNSCLNQTDNPSINQVGFKQPEGSLNSCLNQTVNPSINQVGFIQPEGSLNS